MAQPTEPGDPGFSWGGWIRHGLNVALDMLDVVGAGLPLFGALRNRFPGLNPQEAGGLAATAADASAAAATIPQLEPLEIVDWIDSPTVPGSSIWNGNTGERYRITGTVIWSTPDGSLKYSSFQIFGTDLSTKEETEAAALADTMSRIISTDRDAANNLELVEIIWDAMITQY